jgi:hypothetical protein
MALNSLRIIISATTLMVSTTNVHAAAIATSTISVDWNTFSVVDNVTGTPLKPTTILLPPEVGSGGVTSGGADVGIWYGDQNGEVGKNGDFADNGAPVSVSYISADLNASGTFSGAPGGISSVSASVDASQPYDFRYAGANSYRGQVFEATQTGRIRFSIDAMSSGSASGSGPYFNAYGATSAGLFVFDVEVFLDTFLSELASNGGDEAAAEEAAGLAAMVKQRGWVIDTFGLSDVECVGDGCAPPTSSTSGSLVTGFDVIAGRDYFVELDIEATADAFAGNPSVVPVPAAVWLFGSGLLGLIGVARRKV